MHVPLTRMCVGAHAISTWCNWCADREVLLHVLVLTWCCRRLCGLQPVPARFPCSAEVALRIVLQLISASAHQAGRTIRPLVSCWFGFCLRVVVQVHAGGSVAPTAPPPVVAMACNGCGWVATEVASSKAGAASSAAATPPVSECVRCGGIVSVAGPMWGGATHHPEFVNRMMVLAREYESPLPGESVLDAQTPLDFLKCITQSPPQPLLASSFKYVMGLQTLRRLR